MASPISSPDDVASKVGLRAELLDLTCEENCLLSLSDFVDPWRLVFAELLSSLDLKDIDSENRGASEQEKRVASLRKWKSRNGTDATYRVIVQSAIKCGHVDNAEAICRQLLSQASKHQGLYQSLPPSGDSITSAPPVCTEGEPSNGLNVMIEQLDEQYIEIEQLVFQTIKHRKVPLEDILNWIRFLPMTLRTQFAELIQGQAKVLTSVSNVDELFFILSPYWNSLHPALLEYLVKKLGDNDLKGRMDCYMENLHRFCMQTTLGDFLDKWVGDIPPGYQEFILELGEEWRKRTVEEFEQFRIRLSRLQSFGGDHMSFMKTVKSSSILVILALPEHLFPLNLRQKDIHEFLRDEDVSRVMVDGQCVLDLKELVECEAQLFKKCSKKDSDIDLSEIAHLLTQPGLNPNIFDERGGSLLWWACYLGRTNLVTLLLDNGANVDLPTDDEGGESPLITASWYGHVAVCKVLIERGATIDYQDKEGGTALYAASQRGHKGVVELLLDRGASVDKTNMDAGYTALRVASANGQTEVVNVLIARGAAVDYQDKKGCTALYLASQNGHKEVVELLLDRGASVDKPDMVTYRLVLPKPSEKDYVFLTAYPCGTMGPH